jgi:trehalose 6-phosphate synthase/phosphatase
MSVDIRKQNLGKHIALLEYLKIHDYDFIASFGDDSSDEKVFGVLPAAAATFKVGVGPTVAKYTLEDYRGVAEILRSLVSCVKLSETQRTLSVKSIMPSR